MSFDNLKRNRGSFSQLKERMQKDKQGANSYKDDRFWKLTVKDGTGSAVIRFMPAAEGEEIPYVLRHEHAFQDPTTKKWFIENCPSSIGRDDCPCCISNSELWNTGIEAKQNIARARKRQKKYYANILVVNDPAAPENNGKVFLFQFGPKIFDKINDRINPEFPDEKPCDVFDFWDGANFNLRAHTVNKQRSYDKSAFTDPSELFDGDETQLKAVYDQLHKLQGLMAESEFKSAAELQAKFNAAIGVKASAPVDNTYSHDAVPAEEPEPVYDAPSEPAQSTAVSDDDLDEYQKLLMG